MPSVRVRSDEPFDVILRRFRRSCEKAGIFSEFVNENITKNLHLFASERRQQPSSEKKSAWYANAVFARDPIRLMPYRMRKSGSTNCICDSTASAFE